MIQILIKAERPTVFVIFLAFLWALRILVSSTLRKFLGCEMPVKGPKTLDQIIRNLGTQTTRKEISSLSGVTRNIFPNKY